MKRAWQAGCATVPMYRVVLLGENSEILEDLSGLIRDRAAARWALNGARVEHPRAQLIRELTFTQVLE